MKFNFSDTANLATLLRLQDSTNLIRFLNVSYSNLGGDDRASLCVKISLQDNEDWTNGIFHNSPYAIFFLHSDEKLSLTSSGLNMPKFRKSKIKSLQHAAEKIVQYAQKY